MVTAESYPSITPGIIFIGLINSGYTRVNQKQVAGAQMVSISFSTVSAFAAEDYMDQIGSSRVWTESIAWSAVLITAVI
jgi:hypothetical protein